MKILLTGASGTLGKELLKLFNQSNYEILTPSSENFNVCNIQQMDEYLNHNLVNLLVHSAAYINIKDIEQKNFIKAIDVNIIGTCNIIKLCEKYNIKLIFISTEHVFDGEKGCYKTTDPVNPLTKYAKSKTSAELAVRMYENSLVIRTAFYKYDYPYDTACVDQWSSKSYIDKIAPKIFNAILSNKYGIIHCGENKKSIYEIALERKNTVIPIFVKDVNFKIPKDTSLFLEE